MNKAGNSPQASKERTFYAHMLVTAYQGCIAIPQVARNFLKSCSFSGKLPA